jgi:hypothetical protein
VSGPDQTPKASSEETHGSEAPQGPKPPAAAAEAGVPDGDLPARLGEERLNAPVIRTGMFGVRGTPDTSGYTGYRSWTARGRTAPTSTR